MRQTARLYPIATHEMPSPIGEPPEPSKQSPPQEPPNRPPRKPRIENPSLPENPGQPPSPPIRDPPRTCGINVLGTDDLGCA